MTNRILVTAIVTVIIVFAGFSQVYCQQKPVKHLRGRYIALANETIWEYKFNSKNIYLCKTQGHFGNSITIGIYKIKNDSIILTAYPKNKQKNPNFYFENDILFIENDTCLIDHLGYEHLLYKPDQDTIFSSRRRNLKLPGRQVIND